MPAFAQPAAFHGLLAVGDSAVAQDPLSGDGLGTGIRSAALAASTLAALSGGENQQACINYYSSRLARAMRVHLKPLLAYYEELNDPAWNDEIETMRAGLAVLHSVSEPYGFRLHDGMSLKPVLPPIRTS